MPASPPDLDLERQLFAAGAAKIVIAIDEVGRGALAGPVTIGAIALSSTSPDAPEGVRDSKALTAKRREALEPAVRAWAYASVVIDVGPQHIDEVGLTRALGDGAAAAVSELMSTCADVPVVVLLDGRHDFLTPVDNTWPVQTVVKGDSICASIAAASILAKVHRDALMRDLHVEFPVYGWSRNVGYGTREHRRALQDHGLTDQHRRTWQIAAIPKE